MLSSPCRTLSITIDKPWPQAYEFLADPMNFPLWASGLAKGLKKWGHIWMAETGDGLMKVKFSERNDFGILDHSVFPSADAEVYIPMRVVRSGSGSEIIFTLFQQPMMSAETYEADVACAQKDLRALKALLEAR